VLIEKDWTTTFKRKKSGRPRKPNPHAPKDCTLPVIYERDTFWLRTDKCVGCIPRDSVSVTRWRALRSALEEVGSLQELIPRSVPARAIYFLHLNLQFLV
jgi:hypothetical protein